MRISFSTAALYPRKSIDAIKLLNNSGYSEAELMPQCFHETTSMFAKEIGKMNIKVTSIHFPLIFFSMLYNAYSGLAAEANKLIDDITEMGSELESEIIVIHPIVPFKNAYGDEFTKVIRDKIRYLCDKSQKYGIKIALENHPNGGSSPQELKEAYNVIGHDNLVYMLDTTEAWESGVNPMDFVRHTTLEHLHLSDFSEKSKHLPIGDGIIGWGQLFDALSKKNYKGAYVIEPAYKFYTDNVEQMLIDAHQKVLKYGRKI